MSKHTPGPWVLAESVENRFSKTDMRRVRAANEGYEHGAVCEVYGVRDGSTAWANACLIAAAPTQHEEMLRYLPILERAEADPDLWEKLTEGTGIATANGYRAAIAKATGE